MTNLYLKNDLGIHRNQEDLQISMAVWLGLDLQNADEEKRQQKKREYEKTRKTGRHGKGEKQRKEKEKRKRGRRRRKRREKRDKQKRRKTERRTLLMVSLNIHHSFDKPNKAKRQLGRLHWLF